MFLKSFLPVLAGGVIGLLTYQAPAKQHIVFLCPHGGAKSLIAASYFNRAAETTAHLPYVASAAAAEKPYEAVPSKIADLLERDGFRVRDFKPRHAESRDLTGAARVIAIGCDVTPSGVRIERWDDVPMVDENLPASAAAIRAHVSTLIRQLEAESH